MCLGKNVWLFIIEVSYHSTVEIKLNVMITSLLASGSYLNLLQVLLPVRLLLIVLIVSTVVNNQYNNNVQLV